MSEEFKYALWTETEHVCKSEDATPRNEDGLTEKTKRLVHEIICRIENNGERLPFGLMDLPKLARKVRDACPNTFARALTDEQKEIIEKEYGLHISGHAHYYTDNTRLAFPKAFADEVEGPKVERWERTGECRAPELQEYYENPQTGAPLRCVEMANFPEDHPRWILRKVTDNAE